MVLKLRYALIILISSVIVVYIYFSVQTDHQYIKFLEYSESFNSSLIFDLEIKYVINNNCTTNGAIKLIQIVTSFAGNVEARSALRRAYSKEELRVLGVYRVFLLAKLRPGIHEVTQNAIDNENARYNDIVQGDFFENYRNLTYKHLMGIRWAVSECQAQFIIKMDDDIVVDMYSLKEIIDSKEKTNFDILGYIFKFMRPIRVKANKWFVTKDEFALNTYPTFVSGWLYVIAFKSAKNILGALESERYFWIDDVFVTGVLAQKVNLKMENAQEYFTTNPEYFDCCMRDKVKCGFVVGPSGGDYNLNIEFQKHAKMCYENSCSRYTDGKTFENSCIVSKKLPSIGKGFAKLDVIKL